MRSLLSFVMSQKNQLIGTSQCSPIADLVRGIKSEVLCSHVTLLVIGKFTQCKCSVLSDQIIAGV